MFRKRPWFKWLIISIVLFGVPAAVPGNDQNRTGDFSHVSRVLKREMPYRIIFPADYERKPEKRYPVIYLIHGLGGNYKNWTDLTKLSENSQNYDFLIAMPDGGNGWYSDSVTAQDDKYESYLINEFIPLIDKKFRTHGNRENRVIAGLSMGGYGAVKFGIKYPDAFKLVGSFSGAFDGPLRLKNSPDARVSINEVFGDDNDPARMANDIFRLLREKNETEVGKLPFFYIDCGTEDRLIKTNRDFLALINEKKIAHEYRELPGVHNWEFWDSQIEEFLRVAERKLNRKAKAAAQ
ncbi:MAG: alpha/beta hydrolase family protein [Pyrinomonadaceae bacterium]